jgi:hypothetical protein
MPSTALGSQEQADWDGDGLSDAQEIAMGTDPHSDDSDRDGIPYGTDRPC